MDGPAKEPISLPKLIFLCGPPGSGQEALATELMNRDNDLLSQDFLEPIRMATAMLFFNGNFIQNDLTEEEKYNTPIPTPNDEARLSIRYKDWMQVLTFTLEQQCGEGILGTIALKNLTEDGELDAVFARHIFRDCHNLSDARVFIDHFGPQHCLLIHCGPLTDAAAKGIPNTRSVWLPEPGLDARLKLLERELNLCPPSASSGKSSTTPTPPESSSSNAPRTIQDI
jgi:hypothetical protein